MATDPTLELLARLVRNNLDGKVHETDTDTFFCQFLNELQTPLASITNLIVRRNYPYAGKGDGLTSYLRKRFPRTAYVGVELEVNQRIVIVAGRRWRALRNTLTASLRAACAA